MKVNIKRLNGQSGKETGAILTAITGQTINVQQKFGLENIMMDYAFNTLYPREELNIFRDMYADTPSITVIRDVNDLPNEEIEIK